MANFPSPRPAKGCSTSRATWSNSWTRKRPQDGLLTVFCRHTSASLLVQENASPDAHRDLERWLARIAPESDDYEHSLEGPDDMPSHLRAAVTATQLSIPVAAGRPVLGTWQGIFLFEHRRDPPRRTIALHYIGD